jgi:hypothetical protein
MRIEEERMDVMQNLEFAVVQTYRRHPQMTDYAVERTYDALVAAYSAEISGRSPSLAYEEGAEGELLRQVNLICEILLGRAEQSAEGSIVLGRDTLDVPTLVLCLKRLVKSVKKWTKRNGRQGYLNFISQFIATAPGEISLRY